jgi:hypothetical protein
MPQFTHSKRNEIFVKNDRDQCCQQTRQAAIPLKLQIPTPKQRWAKQVI